MFRITRGTRVAGFLLLQVAAVWQDDFTELRGALGCEDGSSESGSGDSRQVPRVVNVSVGEQYGVDAIGVDGKWLPVALSQLFLSLVEPTIDENPSARRAEQKATARNRLGCTQKLQNCSASRSTQTYPEACIWHADCSKRDRPGFRSILVTGLFSTVRGILSSTGATCSAYGYPIQRQRFGASPCVIPATTH
jgi:hypothetical protein